MINDPGNSAPIAAMVNARELIGRAAYDQV
jgi:hypothetical protein